MTPEQYWIERGADVIGQDVIREGSRARQAPIYMKLVKHILEQGIWDVLDVGCNYGTLQWWLDTFAYGGLYRGIDSNPHAVELGLSMGHKVEQGNLRSLDFPDKSFECVLVKDVLEHLESYEPLAEALRIAKVWVIVSVYIPWIEGPEQIKRQSDGYYTNAYNASEVGSFAESHGFEFQYQYTVKENDGTPNAIYVFRRGAL